MCCMYLIHVLRFESHAQSQTFVDKKHVVNKISLWVRIYAEVRTLGVEQICSNTGVGTFSVRRPFWKEFGHFGPDFRNTKNWKLHAFMIHKLIMLKNLLRGPDKIPRLTVLCHPCSYKTIFIKHIVTSLIVSLQFTLLAPIICDPRHYQWNIQKNVLP